MYRLFKRFSDRNGFTLIEVMIAILILAIGMMAMALLQITAIRGGSFSNQITQASIFGQDKIEELKNKSYTDTDLSNGTHVDNSPPSANGVVFTRSWTVTESNPPSTTGTASSKMKTIDLRVSWTGPQGNSHNVQFSTIVYQ